MKRMLIVFPDELWLKGGNRHRYVQMLQEHLVLVLDSFHLGSYEIIRRGYNFHLISKRTFDLETHQALARIPGVYSVAEAIRLQRDKLSLWPGIQALWEDQSSLPSSFKVRCRRINKKYPCTSKQINEEIGEKILRSYPLTKVKMKKPECVIEIRIYHQEIIIFMKTKNYLGTGGLPVGTSGQLLTLLSGGLDSPVASYLMSKRGCEQKFVFFHAYPFVGYEVVNKITKLVEKLVRYQKITTLYIVPFGEVQDYIARYARNNYRTLCIRGAMIQAANKLAKNFDLQALVTGDSLGQVASQILPAMNLLDQISSQSILRPLLAFNKQEIINVAKKIETHDLSLIPHQDACALFSPNHPTLSPDSNYYRNFFEDVLLARKIKNSLQQVEEISFTITGHSTRSRDSLMMKQ